jgi:quercetin dioxygenase-like cupin family protein
MMAIDEIMNHYSWDDIPLDVLSDTISRKMITGERTMIAQLFIKKGGVVPTHHHENEQISYILEGILEFEFADKTVVLKKGDVLVIPSNVPHKATALEDTVDIDVFTPPRQDWLSGQDAYLRK